MNLPMPAFNLLAANPIEKVVDHVQIGSGFAVVTNHMIMMCVTAVIMLLVFPLLAAGYKRRLVPSGVGNFFEAIVCYLRDEVVRPVLGDDTDRFLPYLLTVFFFILINNLLGLLPLYELTYWLKGLGILPYPIYGTATGNLAVTAVLAIGSFILIQTYAFQQNGVKGYLMHLTAGAPRYMWPIMVPVEIIGMFVKPFALMMRLFANMLAGGIVLKVIVGFVGMAFAGLGVAGAIGVGIPVILGSVFMMVLKLFVAFLQAYLFLFLTSIFIAQMAAHHDHEHDDHGHEGHDAHGHGPAHAH
jgi:F-type H+-transporting ATPase subunit a